MCGTAHVRVVDEIAQVRADRRRQSWPSAGIPIGLAAQIGQDAAIARPQGGGRGQPTRIARGGRAVRRTDRLTVRRRPPHTAMSTHRVDR